MAKYNLIGGEGELPVAIAGCVIGFIALMGVFILYNKVVSNKAVYLEEINTQISELKSNQTSASSQTSNTVSLSDDQLSKVASGLSDTQMGKVASGLTDAQMGKVATGLSDTQMGKVATSLTDAQMGKVATGLSDTQLGKINVTAGGFTKDADGNVVFPANVHVKGNVKVGTDGKYVLSVDATNNFTINKESKSLMKIMDSTAQNNYFDTRLCFDDTCGKYLNINKVYGLTSNQTFTKMTN